MIRVIIVDDDYNVRQGLSAHIPWGELGAEVILLAENGLQVIEKLQETEVDLIISDIRMPFVDGLELLKYINENLLFVDVILLSAYAEFEYAREAISLGAREYVLKPINREKLTKITGFVKRIVEEKEFERQLIFKVHTKEFRDHFKDAVTRADFDEIDHILKTGESYKNLVLYREYCLSLLIFLCELMDEGASSIIRHGLIAEFISLSTIKDCQRFMKERCREISEKQYNGNYTKSSQMVNKITSYVNENYFDSALNVQGIAAHFGLSPEYLSTMFKSENGNPLSEWIINCRLSKAIELLHDSNMTIQQISHKVGYDDVRYFMRIFKKRLGMTPTQYRTGSRREEA